VVPIPSLSAPLLIGLRVRVCGGAVGTANVGSRAPTCLTFYMALREGGPLSQTAGAPNQGASRIGKLIRRSLRGDHFSNKRIYKMNDRMLGFHFKIEVNLLVPALLVL
jgi:hypothetical protein